MRAVLGRDARAGVVHLDVQGVGVAGQADAHALRRGRAGLGDGVEGVVDEVADEGDEVARVDGELGGQAARDLEVDAALGRLRGLAEQQRRQDRLLDGRDELVGEPLGDLELGGRELDGLLRRGPSPPGRRSCGAGWRPRGSARGATR